MLLDKIKTLCDEREETLASLERKMDFGNGTIRRWDKITPSADKLAKVADFFHVSVDYLLGREKEENVAASQEDESEITFDDFTYALHSETQELTEENKQKLLEMAKLFKLSQKHDKDEKK